MPRKKTTDETDDGKSDDAGGFEASLLELQQIVGDLEGGDLKLADCLDRYERGIGLLKSCHQFLDAAEQRVSQWVGWDADGNPMLQELQSIGDGDLHDKQRARQQRRSAKPTSLEADNGARSSNPRPRRTSGPDCVDDFPELF